MADQTENTSASWGEGFTHQYESVLIQSAVRLGGQGACYHRLFGVRDARVRALSKLEAASTLAKDQQKEEFMTYQNQLHPSPVSPTEQERP
ncbi:hypothetical protein PPTG_20684 [Phytophthora nicotianae INRA-310]|uniref:Uncharacterized protein n=1 Tax=Phytophthora nicotianae (strain INRA-310) TaxID=761204 RepID=W2RG50_PHYN3|nr:hypothetical protein PPTG_20684 [Phytophthora nicotianae INRA-310]ETN23649.1 hypothetical protein PPTG_20684 [Phytophthora nicotianae INRA-310]